MGDGVGKAGELIFGPGFEPPPDLEGETWQREVREAWRRRALETHPDRAAALGRDERELAREFQALADAYRTLCPAGGAPEAAPPGRPQPPVARPPPRPARPPVDHLHRGGLPRRALLFAEYLYYSGRVSWRNLVEAVAWQRRQRPPIGRIAVEWGQLDDGQVREVLQARRRGDGGKPFGECAREMGLLTGVQVLSLLGRQRRLQRRIGEYFVEAGLVAGREVPAVEAELVAHNARFRRER
ncbi:MAG TPA: J domain-containing protein [Anaeromyxobacteraceae bacterium]|nr:J domain-containing protein [Anaeromyxobacteraceae bacterium]